MPGAGMTSDGPAARGGFGARARSLAAALGVALLGGASLAHAAEPAAAPVAWGQPDGGLRMGLRPEAWSATGLTPPGWTVLYENVGKAELVLPAAGQAQARLRINVVMARPVPDRTGDLTLDFAGAGNPLLRGETQQELRLAPGQRVEVPLKAFLKSDPAVHFSAQASFEFVAPPDVECWQGAPQSGAVSFRRTKQGWALSHAIEHGKPLPRDDWAAAEQVWEEFRQRKAEFVTGLQAEDLPARRDAVCALGKLGADAADAVTALAKLLAAEDPYAERPLHQDIVWALGETGRDANATVAVLAKALADQDEDNRAVRLQAVRTLVGFRHSPARLAALVAALKDTWGAVRCEAAIALGKTGPLAKGALPALEEALKDPLGVVHEAAREAVARIRAGGPP